MMKLYSFDFRSLYASSKKDTMSEIQKFHGIKKSDLRPCSIVETRHQGETKSHRFIVNTEDLPFERGTVIFEAGPPLSNNDIEAVGVVISGSKKKSTVLILEVADNSSYVRGQSVEIPFETTWRGKLIDYVLTKEQRQELADFQEKKKLAATQKRRETMAWNAEAKKRKTGSVDREQDHE